ncbi:PKD domain-containing protein [Flavobacterium sp.]|uniref:PKD domain-containing protein n=1 Tax=Flavobacterium sp. TaxID=239 RepID=UPI00262A01F9|nr:PKD domain-containing protein [Flavobacterium sp.]
MRDNPTRQTDRHEIRAKEQSKSNQQLTRNRIYILLLVLCAFNLPVWAQTGNVYLTWDNNVGCQVSGNSDRKDYFELIASGECLRVCGGSLVTYTVNQYDSSWISTDWVVNGGTKINSGTQTCQVSWNRGTIGTGSISGIIHTTNGDIVIQELCVEILDGPRARFAKAPFNFSNWDNTDLKADMEVCKNVPIQFLDGSLTNGGTPIIDFQWNFGDGVLHPTTCTSTEQNPTHTYLEAGRFPVSLTVTNSCGCSKTTTRYVNVGARGIKISCPGVVCPGQQSTYSVVDPQPGCGYDWTVVGGTILGAANHSDVKVDWTRPVGELNDDGFGYISATPNQCGADCFAPTTLRIPIIRPSIKIDGATTICGKSQERYTMPQWPTTEFEWQIVGTTPGVNIIYTDQRNEIIIDSDGTAGFITLEVVYQNTFLKCGGRATKNIEIKGGLEILGPTKLCMGTTSTFTLASGLSATWTVRKMPNGPVTSYTGVSFSPLASVFAATGQYGVSADAPGSCSSEYHYVTVISNTAPLDAAMLDSRLVCPGRPSVFSMVNDIPGTVLVWSVAPGVGTIVGNNYGNEVQVIFNYPIAGTYAISVRRESNSGPACPSENLEIPLQLVPFNMPQIDGLNYVCGSTYQNYEVAEAAGELYQWTIEPANAGSVVANGSRTVRILWNQFPSLQNATLKVAVTKCNIPKEKTLNVTIADPSITINVPSTGFCKGTSQNFSINPTPTLTSGTVTWDFGDGQTITGPVSTTASVNYAYAAEIAAPTTYTVKVKVDSPNACHSFITATATVSVLPLPKAFLTPDSYDICGQSSPNVPITVNLVDNGPIVSVTWYHNGNVVTNPNTNPLVFNATTSGHYYAVISNGSCQSSTDQMAIDGCGTCSENPVMNLTLTRNCKTVVATGTYVGTTPMAAGYSSSETPVATTPANATFEYTTPGNKIVSYVLTYPDCQVTKSASILIPYIPKVGVDVQCTATGNQYSVRLFDNSLYYNGQVPSGNSWVYKINNVIQPRLSTDIVSERTLLLAAGQTYVFELTIGASPYEYCTQVLNFDLRNVPNPNFSVQTPICQHTAEVFTAVDQPNTTFEWNFGDNSYNYQQNPEKEFSYGIKVPILTVTDQYGCSRNDNHTIIVNRNDQQGTIEPPLVTCPGRPNILYFSQNAGFTGVTSVQWLLDNVPIPGAITGPDDGFTATESGGYSVIVGNADGCTVQLPQSMPVAIMRDPFTSIEGPSYACLNQPFKLYVPAGAGAGYTYSWYDYNDTNTELSNTNEMTATLTAEGHYTFLLVVGFTLPDGTNCGSTFFRDVIVDTPPVITDLYGTVRNCSPFEVKLWALAEPSGGVYNWSDGQDGPMVMENQGGVYEMTYTAPGGCRVSGQVNVEKNLENFMWVFPTGCYERCLPLTDAYLIGPDIVSFNQWHWLENDMVAQSASTNVDNHHLTDTSNVYNLQLKTQRCDLTSGDMIVSAVDCKDCKIGNTLLATGSSNEPFFHYTIQLHIDNTDTTPQSVNVTAPTAVGVIVPGTVIVPPDTGGNFTFSLIPDPSYTGASTMITLRSNQGKLCIGDQEIQFLGESRETVLGHNEKTGADLRLYPNPATATAEVSYDFGAQNANESNELLVYDLYGRKLEAIMPAVSQGVWSLATAGYGAGTYIVVMKRGGKLVQQKILVVKN